MNRHPLIDDCSRGLSSSDHSRISIGYLAAFLVIYVVGSGFWVQSLPAVIFIRRLYGGLAGSELARCFLAEC